MNRLAVFLTGIAGLAIWVVLVVSGAGHVGGGVPTAAPDAISAAEMAEMAADAEAAVQPGGDAAALPEVGLPGGDTPVDQPAAGTATRDTAVETKAVRPVEPDTFDYPVARGDQPLERIEARPTRDGAASRTSDLQPVLLQRPGTVKAGVLAFGKNNLQLAEIVPTDILMRCTDPSGSEWPCGSAARTALRLFLRNRAVSCDLPGKVWKSDTIATCRLGEKNVSAWLVENGWAEPAKGSALEALGAQAKAARRGLYGDDPRRKPDAEPSRTP